MEAAGCPPSVAQHLRPAIGYAVTAPCAADRVTYTELDLGFGRASGTKGGGWIETVTRRAPSADEPAYCRPG